MNSNIFLEKDGNILPIPARLPFRSTDLYPAPDFSLPKLRAFAESGCEMSRDLYAYAMASQHRNESIERLAFAALAGSSIAGILSVFI